MKEPQLVTFSTPDDAVLTGTLYGSGDVAVIFRDGKLQARLGKHGAPCRSTWNDGVDVRMAWMQAITRRGR